MRSWDGDRSEECIEGLAVVFKKTTPTQHTQHTTQGSARSSAAESNLGASQGVLGHKHVVRPSGVPIATVTQVGAGVVQERGAQERECRLPNTHRKARGAARAASVIVRHKGRHTNTKTRRAHDRLGAGVDLACQLLVGIA